MTAPPRPAQPAEPPSLTSLGWREVGRGVEIWLVLVLVVGRTAAAHAWRERRLLVRLRRDRAARRALADAVSTGLVEAFMALGPTFVKLGQMIASSPGMFPAPLADACLRTLDDVPPFPADEALAIVEDDLGAPADDAVRRRSTRGRCRPRRSPRCTRACCSTGGRRC